MINTTISVDYSKYVIIQSKLTYNYLKNSTESSFTAFFATYTYSPVGIRTEHDWSSWPLGTWVEDVNTSLPPLSTASGLDVVRNAPMSR